MVVGVRVVGVGIGAAVCGLSPDIVCTMVRGVTIWVCEAAGNPLVWVKLCVGSTCRVLQRQWHPQNSKVSQNTVSTHIDRVTQCRKWWWHMTAWPNTQALVAPPSRLGTWVDIRINHTLMIIVAIEVGVMVAVGFDWEYTRSDKRERGTGWG